MSGSLREAKLNSRQARAALGSGLHWRQIDADVHLGYRKGAKGGHWLVRWYVGDGNYKRAQLGVADDLIAEGTLSFDQAGRKARTFVAELRKRAARQGNAVPETVRSAVSVYVSMRNERLSTLRPGTRQKSDAASRLNLYVLKDDLADVALPALTEDLLNKWKARFAPDCGPGSRLRTMNDLKAALNLAHRTFRKQLPPDFAETVRWGLRADQTVPASPSHARENQILSDATVRDIVEAAAGFDDDGDVGRIVLVLAATGARFSQVQRITVGDVQPERQRLFVPTSRKGQGKAESHIPVPVGRDVIDALRCVTVGRQPDEMLLCRWRMKQAKGIIWVRDYRGPWTSAAEITRQWRTICADLGLAGVIPYALRHSSIVRAIRAGLPIRLVAAMHDTSVAMIERHYARYIVDGLEELAAKAVVPMVKYDLREVA